MALPLRYDISVIGQDKLKRAMRGVVAEAKAASRQMNAAAKKTPGGGSPDAEAKRRAAAEKALDKQRSAALYKQFRDKQSAEKALDRQRAAALYKQHRDRESAERKAHATRVANIQKENVAESRALQRTMRARQSAARSAVAGAGRTVRSVGGKLVGIGGTALGIGTAIGGFAAGGAVAHQIEIQRRASQLANQAGRPEIKGQLAAEAQGVKGFSGTEALAGLEAFVDITGDLDSARALLPDLGRLALATGTDIAELAATAGNAFIPLSDQIKDPTERMKQMRSVMAALAGQGQVGAVEIKDLAKEYAGLAAAANRFGGNPEQNLKIMGALAQAARQRGGADSAAEAVTSVARFSSDVIKRPAQKKLGALGIDVFQDEGKTQLKAPKDIILDVLEKTGGNLTKVMDIFGERGIRAFQGFAPLFTRAEAKKKGTGRAAVEAEFSRLMGAQLSVADVEKRAKSREQDPDILLKENLKKFNKAVGTKLLPTIIEMIPRLEQMIPPFTELAEAVAELAPVLADDLIPIFKEVVPAVADTMRTLTDTFGGIGGIVAAVITAELVSAGIGKLVGSVLSSLMAGAAARMTGAQVAGAAASGLSALSGGGAAAAGGAAARGGILARAGGLLGKAGGALTGLLGVAGATAAAGGAAVGGIGLAAWQGKKLFDETGGFSDFGGDTARVASGDDYDAFMRRGGMAPSQSGDKTASVSPVNDEAATKQMSAADKNLSAAEKNLAAAALLAAAPNNARRNDPIIARNP